MKKILLCFTLVVCAASLSYGQKYSSAIGVRLSDARYGLSFRYAFTEAFTGEVAFDLQADEWAAFVLPKYHFPLLGRGLNFYVGAGAHLGNLKDFGTTYGLDALAGLEFRIPILPFTISTEVKPAYHIRHEDWFEFPATLSIHYLIDKRSPKKRKRIRERKQRKKERKERRDEHDGKLIILPWNKK